MADIDSVREQFVEKVHREPDTTPVVVAISVLIEFLGGIKSSVTTVAEVLRLLKSAIHVMQKSESADAGLESGCEIFNWYITRFTADPSFETRSLEEIMDEILKYGRQYLDALQAARGKIATYGKNLLRNNSTVLVHSKSRCVLEVIKAASASSKNLNIVVTQSLEDAQAAVVMVKEIQSFGLNARLIPEGAVGFEMEKVDVVCVGAEAVCLSGGIVNRIGTLTIALCAQAMNKPFYVFAESHKFTKTLFPLSNSDVHCKWMEKECNKHLQYPNVDYTEPNLITYVVSDLGILTPAIVCEQLLRLYE